MAQSQFTSEEKERIINMFESMDAKPKLDDQDDLEEWMSDYLATKGQSRMTMQRDKSTDDRPDESVHRSTILHKPKITSFSGNDEPKGISYATWRYEVDTLLREGIYTKLDVEIAAKKSLRGGASDVVRRMRIHAVVYMELSKTLIASSNMSMVLHNDQERVLPVEVVGSRTCLTVPTNRSLSGIDQ